MGSNLRDPNPHSYGTPVVGYVRSPRLNDPDVDVLDESIRLYARQHGYNLVRVFRDVGISSVAAWRPEFEQLLRGLERHEWAGVIIPDESHWSRKPLIARRMSRRISL